MRIFVLGAGATGSLLAQLLHKQGHRVWCGDRDPERARRFLGKRSPIPVHEVNARNLWGIVRAARGCQLLINTAPAVFNQIVLRAALRLRAHYLDTAAHLSRNPFRAEQFRYAKRFAAKRRAAVIIAGAAPGLTNLLVKRSAELLTTVEAAHVYLYESTESDDPISQWSHQESFEEAVARPRVYRSRRFHLARRFSERERFRFPPPVGEVVVVLAAQDEVTTLPYFIPMREMLVKIGGNEIDRLRRWYRQGKLTKSRGAVAARFPRTPTPRAVARMIRRGVLQNARFAVAVVVRGARAVRGREEERPLEVRWDVTFPTLYRIRRRGLFTTPIAYASAHLAALFIKHFPRELAGVFPPEALPAETRRAVLANARSRDIRLEMKVRRLKKTEDEEEEV
jgi:hypothetical protein